LDRIPAKELEQLVSSRIQKFLASPQELSAACLEFGYPGTDLSRSLDAAQTLAAGWTKLTSTETANILRRSVRQIVIRESEIEIQVDVAALKTRVLEEDSECSHPHRDESCSAAHVFTLTAPFTITRHRGELRLVLPGTALTSGKGNSSLLKAIARAQRWRQRIIDGEIYSKEQLASEAKLDASYVGRIFRLAALAPRWLDTVVRHREMAGHPLSEMLSRVPLEWREQDSFFLAPVDAAPVL
jgi:hypothetical protein